MSDMMFKKLVSGLLSAVMLTGSFGLFQTTSLFAADEDDFMTAKEIVDSITMGYNIGNNLESTISGEWMLQFAKGNPTSFETAWGNPVITQELVNAIKDTGINAIRIPVTWYQNLEGDGTINENWLARVKEVIDYIIDEDTFVIINMHHDNGSNGWQKASAANYTQYQERYASIWNQIAVYFKDYNDHLIFEGMNEVLDESGNWSYTTDKAIDIVNKYNQLFVDTVRATGGNNLKRVLIADTYAAGVTTNILQNWKLPDDTASERLIAEIHSYAPYPFCSGDYPDVTKLNDESVTSMLHNVNKHIASKDIPVILGEFGCVNKNNLDERVRYADLVTRTANNYGIKCFWWDNGGDFKMIDRKTYKWQNPEILQTMLKNSGINWNEKDGIIDRNAVMTGDINADGKFSVADVLLLQKWLLAVPDTELPYWQAADLCKDNKLNIFDLCLLKRALLRQNGIMESSDWKVSDGDKLDIAGSTITFGTSDSDSVTLTLKSWKPENGKKYKLSFYYQGVFTSKAEVKAESETSTIFSETLTPNQNEQGFEKEFTWTSDETGTLTFKLVTGGNTAEMLLSDFTIRSSN